MLKKWVKERIKRDRESSKNFKEFIEYVVNRFEGRVSIILFGSRAKKEHLLSSDYDVMIIANKYRNDNMFERIVDLRIEFGKNLKIHLFPLTKDEFFKSYEEGSIIVIEAIMDGTILFDGLNISEKIESIRDRMKSKK